MDEGSGTQFYPEVAANANTGGYLAAWRDWRNNTLNVYGRRVSGSGQTQGESFPIGPVTGKKQYPWAAFNEAAGEYLLVWEDYRDGDADVYGQRLTEVGEPVGGNFHISDAAGDQTWPRVAAAGAAGYLVVWEDRRDDNLADVYGQLVATDGALVGDNFVIAATGEGQDYPDLAYNPDDGLYLAVWRDKRADTYGDIYGQLIASDGTLSGGNFVVSAYGGQTQTYPAVTYNGSAGEFLVVWRHWQSSGNEDIYGQRLSGQGALLDNLDTPADESEAAVSFPICTEGSNQYYPRASADETSGNYLVTWLDTRNYSSGGYDIYGQVIAPTGALSGDNIALCAANGNQRWPSVAPLAGTQGFLATWNDDRSGSWTLYGQRLSADGTLVGEEEQLVEGVSWVSGLAMAAHASAPEVLLTWEWYDEIYAQRYGVLVADFEAAPRLGSAPLTVTFTNLSAPTSEITAYEWDFGDGTPTSAEVEPVHTYTQPGVYTVTLTASGPAGSNVRVRPAYITVNTPFTPETDLRGYWRLDESTGLRHDLSGYDHHLAPVGGVRWAEAGYIGSAVDLEKDDEAYLVLNDPLQSGLDITGSLTLMGWARPESSSGNYMMMAAKYRWYYGGVENAGYRLGLLDDNRLHFIVSPDGTYQSAYRLDGPTVLETGAWHHVAAVFDAQAQEMHLYLDGVPEASKAVNFDHIHPSAAPFMLGADLDDQGEVTQYFDGLLDEWRVYARALSQAEIEEIMQLPGASFVATPRQGFIPLEVTFTNTSTNTTTYRWD